MTHLAAANQYIKDVISGAIPACEYVKRACQRQVDDLAAAKLAPFVYRFDEAKAERICKFLEVLPHTKGVWAARRETITLEPWQKFIFTTVFGWVHKSTGMRRFREAYIEVARKNGKSIIGAGIGLYMFAADGEFGAEVYSGASTEKQAWEVFRPAKLMIERDEELREHLGIQVNAKTLNCPSDMSRFEPIIGKPGDGSSPSCAIADEFHEHATDEQVSTMITGMGARTQPLMLYITTAGFNTGGPCYAKRSDVIKILEGTYDAPDVFGVIYTLDQNDDWASPESLQKANPNFGVSVSSEFLLAEQRKAIQSAHLQNNFKTKHLNIWCGALAAYFNAQKLEACVDKTLRIEDFAGGECMAAVDLASKTDFAGNIAMFKRMMPTVIPETCHRCGGEVKHFDRQESRCSNEDCQRAYKATMPHYFAFTKFYLPEATANDEEKKQYAAWVNAGHVTATPGEIIDYEWIEADLTDMATRHKVLEVAVDKWNATQFMTRMANESLLIVDFPMNVQHLSEPMKEMDALIKAGRFHFDGNPVLKWMITNVAAKTDPNDNVFPRKDRPENKIDGAVGCIMALARWIVQPEDAGTVFDQRAAAGRPVLRRF